MNGKLPQTHAALIYKLSSKQCRLATMELKVQAFDPTFRDVFFDPVGKYLKIIGLYTPPGAIPSGGTETAPGVTSVCSLENYRQYSPLGR